ARDRLRIRCPLPAGEQDAGDDKSEKPAGSMENERESKKFRAFLFPAEPAAKIVGRDSQCRGACLSCWGTPKHLASSTWRPDASEYPSMTMLENHALPFRSRPISAAAFRRTISPCWRRPRSG